MVLQFNEFFSTKWNFILQTTKFLWKMKRRSVMPVEWRRVACQELMACSYLSDAAGERPLPPTGSSTRGAWAPAFESWGFARAELPPSSSHSLVSLHKPAVALPGPIDAIKACNILATMLSVMPHRTLLVPTPLNCRSSRTLRGVCRPLWPIF
jgi:hypothetical protein